MGLLPKVIPLKLFLDMVPSSSEDVTCAMLDSWSDFFLETTRDKMVGTLFYMFRFRFIPEMFSALSAFCSASLSFVLCSFGYSLFCCLFGFREFKLSWTLTAMVTRTMAMQACVIAEIVSFNSTWPSMFSEGKPREHWGLGKIKLTLPRYRDLIYIFILSAFHNSFCILLLWKKNFALHFVYIPFARLHFSFVKGYRVFLRDVIKFLNPKLKSHRRFYPH